jgi:hypothetical protein
MNIIQPLNIDNFETVLDNIVINQNITFDNISELNNKIELHNQLLTRIDSELTEIKLMLQQLTIKNSQNE